MHLCVGRAFPSLSQCEFELWGMVVETLSATASGISGNWAGMAAELLGLLLHGLLESLNSVLRHLTCSTCGHHLFADSENQSREKESALPDHINWFLPFNTSIFP